MRSTGNQPQTRRATRAAPDAFTTAVALLGQRELTEAQLRARLARRGCDETDVDRAIARLRQDRTLDDERVARAAARLESAIRRRGPVRVRQRLHALGLSPDVVQRAVADAFDEVDATALLDAALERRLRGRPVSDLDAHARARLIRGLVNQGFALGEVLKRVRDGGPD